ncbi:MAG: ABC transporter ATP-binding protein [Myxococcota bacterium]
MSDVVLRCAELTKRYRAGFWGRRIDALRGVTFEVERGEIFGFLGVNGAGKTTTFKILVGLLFATSGRAEIFGVPAGAIEAKRRLGFLPESPYFYEYLTGRELLDYVGRLFGLSRGENRRRGGELLERLGLGKAADTALRRYSKGMLQRVGVAQALMGDPDLLILDEPMTGLDPLGRKELRDFIGSLRERGKTVVFSTHVLPDVELLCDRVAILRDGRIHDVGPLGRLVSARILSTEIVVDGEPPELLARLGGLDAQARGGQLVVVVAKDGSVDVALSKIAAAGGRIVQVTPRRETLEDVFVRATSAAVEDSPSAGGDGGA